MPKHAYIKKGFSQSSLDLIERCNRIVVDYQRQGYSLTLRQLYYRLVAGGRIPNTTQSYKRLGRIVNEARLTGHIDWLAIEDRTRSLRDKGRWENPTAIMRAMLDGFIIDRWAGQEWRVEVWVEKDALIGIVGQVANQVDVPYFSCRGYTSQSEMWRAARRVKSHLVDGQKVLIVHLADHDPSGIDMTRDIIDRFQIFWADNVRVERIALTMEQVEEYQPPPNPAKITDSRYSTYVLKFGTQSWELDALEPAVITELISTIVTAHRDELMWHEVLEREKAMRVLLDDALEMVEENDKW